ncbi:hypothetical protein ABTN03_19675, partial [Acinetobacter baumannii]
RWHGSEGYLILFFLLAFSLPFWGGGYLLSLGVSVLLYAFLASSWAIFTGPSRLLSLATSAFFGTGAYAVALLHERLSWAFLIPLG